ncbi:hypothetical protein [Aeromonas hydrophila]|uniref:hypothetical protein n=1 Tax=Aeromonas hydrophila TaxID=644 RepID=UPI003986652A
MLGWGGVAESNSGAGWRLAALLLAVLGTVFGLGGVLRFRRQGTTVTPLHPEQASALVTGGLLVWLGPLLLWGWLSRWQIVPEERALQARVCGPF